jgi:hypothetical protein
MPIARGQNSLLAIAPRTWAVFISSCGLAVALNSAFLLLEGLEVAARISMDSANGSPGRLKVWIAAIDLVVGGMCGLGLLLLAVRGGSGRRNLELLLIGGWFWGVILLVEMVIYSVGGLNAHMAAWAISRRVSTLALAAGWGLASLPREMLESGAGRGCMRASGIVGLVGVLGWLVFAATGETPMVWWGRGSWVIAHDVLGLVTWLLQFAASVGLIYEGRGRSKSYVYWLGVFWALVVLVQEIVMPELLADVLLGEYPSLWLNALASSRLILALALLGVSTSLYARWLDGERTTQNVPPT